MNDESSSIKLDLLTVGFSDSCFLSNGYKWTAQTLYEAAEDLPEFDLPLAGIDLGVMPWAMKNVLRIAEHMNRVNKTDLKYPILLDDLGFICDGWHRVIKALLEGKTHIKAKRLQSMPNPDEIIEEDDDEYR